MIRNPILPGFNPDPAITRVGEDYYIATSTMVWQPGIRVFHLRFPLGTGHPETRQRPGEGCPGATSLEVSRAVP
jgi:hypothetical protein